MKRLGVTGGIGSGKSYICRIMQERFGIPVYNCDIRARIITCSHPDVINQLMSLDEGFYTEDGELDKVRLAQYMFASEENLRKVNGIIHPAVREDLHEWYGRHESNPLVIVESAILYESHFQTEVDYVLFVDAPVELRIRRAAIRDSISEEQVRQRMLHQQTEDACRRADFVLFNEWRGEASPRYAEMLKSNDADWGDTKLEKEIETIIKTLTNS